MTVDVFKSDAKTIVDMAFDSDLFNDSMTRDKMNTFEELIGFLLKSKYEGYVKSYELLKRLKHINKTL